ncbi:MAG: hypothetical protein QOD39_814 [Mycobacterium sp.]|nr:hypothetical protein [Mycobacterium sp.]
MGYGRFVGRVGALAVALGVGMLAPAVAAADTDADKAAGADTRPSGSPENPSAAGAASADEGADSGHPESPSPADSAVDPQSTSDADTKPDTDVEPDAVTAIEEDDDAAQELPKARKSGSDSHRTKKFTDGADVGADQPADKVSQPGSSVSTKSASPRTVREVRPSVRPEAPDVAPSVAAVPVTKTAPAVLQTPAPARVSVPMAVLGALGVLPVGPVSPVGGLHLTEVLWGAYRRTESEEDEQTTTLAATPMTRMAMASAQAAAPAGPSVDYAVSDDWGAGFVGNMTVNAGPSALNGWTVEFDTPAQITNIWNAEIASHTANHYVVRNAAWNGQVGAGQATSFGFQGSGVSSSVTNLTVNGAPTGQPTTPPSVSIGDATVSEGNSGTSNLNFNVTLSKASTSPVTVGCTTANGTATAGQDYTAKSGSVAFAAGETTKTVTVAIAGDTTVEPNETLTVTLSNPSGATIADGSAVGTITNDDVQPPPSGASVVYSKTDDWGQGFTGNVNLTAGQSALNGWTVEFDSPAQVTNVWNGVIASHTGNHYVVRNEAWNGQVAAGQTTSFGFQATPGGTSATATNFVVNGIPSGQQTPPSVSVADAAVAEGSSGTRNLNFNVTLSKSSTSPVTVAYATSNGTATAGQDYTAKSGTVTFAAGETTKAVTVTVTGDVTAEPNETLTVTLSNPSGATIADGSAIGTITNDDGTPPLPGVSISDASALEGDPGVGGIAPGPLHTSGNQIVDSTGKPVQLSGVNWFGAQSSNGVPDGLWTRNYKDMIDQMSDEGFNTIRVPYASAMLHTTAAPAGINYNANPDLQGLSRIQVMDKIIDYAGQKGMRVILDHHRSTEGGGTSDNGLWYDSQYTEDQWVADWQTLATRYKNNPTVIGFDLHNEPYNGTWGGGGANDWARAAERAANASLAVNPNLLMFVEGVGTYKGDSYWWGGQLQGVKDRPIVLSVPNRVVYSPHDYPNSVYAQPWFQGANFGAALPAKFRSEWGYIYEQNIAPIYMGEFGTRLQDPKDVVWLEAITSYLSGDLDNNGTIDIPAGTEDMSWTFWSWNPNSTDTGGILADDWRTVNENKMVYLHPIEYANGSGGASLATFTLTLAQPSSTPVTVNYATSNGSATAGSDYVAATGSVTFAPGETSKTVTVVVLGDAAAEGSENFTVLLSNPVGATIVDGSGRGTIVDDEAV